MQALEATAHTQQQPSTTSVHSVCGPALTVSAESHHLERNYTVPESGTPCLMEACVHPACMPCRELQVGVKPALSTHGVVYGGDPATFWHATIV
jgi:hypothetical protein